MPSFPSKLLAALRAWWGSDAFELGAALAYYVVFSFGPVLLLMVAIAGTIFGEEPAQGLLFHHLTGALGEPVATSVQNLLAASRVSSANVAASVIGTCTLFIGASGFFAHLKRSLNRLWKVEPPSVTVRTFLQRRLVSTAAVMALGLLLTLLLLADTALSAYGGAVIARREFPSAVLHSLSFLASFGLLVVIFGLLYQYLPDANVPWQSAWLGGAITSFLFCLGKVLVGLYLGQTSVASVYGAAGSVIVILLSAYYFSLIIFLGAEFVIQDAKGRG